MSFTTKEALKMVSDGLDREQAENARLRELLREREGRIAELSLEVKTLRGLQGKSEESKKDTPSASDVLKSVNDQLEGAAKAVDSFLKHFG